MKKLLHAFLFTFVYFISYSQPVVYFDFVTHNEETFNWNTTGYYTTNRARLVNLGNYFQANGVTWNMQSDWVYLSNVLTQETPALTATTNNKNILMWLQSDKGVEMDPHAHESTYIYPDVVKLMDSIGLPESKLMGGSIYNDSNGMNIWTNLINGQYGVIFPNHFWQPDYMMGGGTPNHVNDLKYYGFWNPQSTSNYLTNDTTNHLRHLGVGCSMKIQDTSSVANVMADINDVIQKVQTGQYPANGFYLQTIFFEQASLNNMMFYNKVIAVADSVNAIIASGVAQWKTLKQAYTEWETTYNAQMFQWECGQIASATQIITENKFNVYPNPATGKINFEMSYINNFKPVELNVYNMLGKIIYQSVLNNHLTEIDLKNLSKGIYYYRLKNKSETLVTNKIILQ